MRGHNLHLGFIVFAVAMATGSVVAQAQSYPTRPLRVVAPFTPGGGVDFTARLLGAGLAEAFGQPVVVENRPGAGGSLGADFVARAHPDGHTLVMGNNSTHAVNQALNPKLPYHSLKSFTPISLIATAPNLLLTGAKSPARNLREFIALAKSKPGELYFGSSGTGSQNHLSGELLNYMAGIKVTHVPFKGSIGPGLAALLSGEIQLFWASTTGASQHVSSGRLLALAITGENRSVAAPEVPTFVEQGVKGFETGPWYALLGPAGIPDPIVNRLYQETARIVRTAEFQKKLVAQGAEGVGSTPSQCAETISSELSKWTRLVKETGIK